MRMNRLYIRVWQISWKKNLYVSAGPFWLYHLYSIYALNMRDTQFKRRAWQIGWKKTCMFPRDPFCILYIFNICIIYALFMRGTRLLRRVSQIGWKKTCMYPRDPFVTNLYVSAGTFVYISVGPPCKNVLKNNCYALLCSTK